MPAFLIVDDNPKVLQWLRECLGEEFPGARIDEAMSYTDALRLAEDIGNLGQSYDVAVLDVYLPIDVYSENAADRVPDLYAKERGQLYRALTRDTMVIDHSAHADREEVRSFIEGLDPNSAVNVVIKAVDRGKVADEMMEKARAAVYGRRVEVSLNHMLADRQLASSAARGDGGAQDVLDLMCEIRDHWRDLDDEVQRRARLVFDIVERDDGQIIVNRK